MSLTSTTNTIDTGSDIWAFEQDRSSNINRLQMVSGTMYLENINSLGDSTRITLANGAFSVAVEGNVYTMDGSYDSDDDVATKADVDAAVVSGMTADQLLELSNRGIQKPELITAAEDSLALDLVTFQSGTDKYKTKIITKDNGRLDLFPPSNFNTFDDGTTWRGQTHASNDTIAINPLNGVVVRFDGQAANNAGYITGEFGQFYAQKVANDTLVLSAPEITAYTYSAAAPYSPNNLYTEASAMNADNEALSLGNWSINVGAGATAVVDAGGSAGGSDNAIRVQETGPVGDNFYQLSLDLAALGLDDGTPMSAGDYDIKFDMKVVSMPATDNLIQLEITGAGANGFTGISYGSDGQSTYSSYSHTFTGDETQSNIRFYITTTNTDPAGSIDVYFKNFELVPTGQ